MFWNGNTIWMVSLFLIKNANQFYFALHRRQEYVDRIVRVLHMELWLNITDVLYHRTYFWKKDAVKEGRVKKTWPHDLILKEMIFIASISTYSTSYCVTTIGNHIILNEWTWFTTIQYMTSWLKPAKILEKMKEWKYLIKIRDLHMTKSYLLSTKGLNLYIFLQSRPRTNSETFIHIQKKSIHLRLKNQKSKTRFEHNIDLGKAPKIISTILYFMCGNASLSIERERFASFSHHYGILQTMPPKEFFFNKVMALYCVVFISKDILSYVEPAVPWSGRIHFQFY